MKYHFKNLVLEGGGVKGIAYIGAMEVLQKKNILSEIERVGGTSAGAINAVLLGLNFSVEETKDILWKLDFNKFKDDSFFFGRDTWRFLTTYGWHKGDFFKSWIGELVEMKTGNPNATFMDVHKNQLFKDIYLVGTNISTRFAEIFSHETTPDMPVAEAARISMSIPLFFTAVKRKKPDGKTNFYADGGVLNNYPIKLFDRMRFLSDKKNCSEPEYYAKHNKGQSDKNIYNKETLGFRLDSAGEIGVFSDGRQPEPKKINNLFQYTKALMDTMMEAQQNNHLKSDDWQRTIYIDTLGIKTTQFDLNDNDKKNLIDSGRAGIEKYFTWYDKAEDAANKPA